MDVSAWDERAGKLASRAQPTVWRGFGEEQKTERDYQGLGVRHLLSGAPRDVHFGGLGLAPRRQRPLQSRAGGTRKAVLLARNPIY